MKWFIFIFLIFNILLLYNFSKENYRKGSKIDLNDLGSDDLKMISDMKKKDLEDGLVQVLNNDKVKEILKKRKNKVLNFDDKMAEASLYMEEMGLTTADKELSLFFPPDHYSKMIWFITLANKNFYKIPHQEIIKQNYLNELIKSSDESANSLISIISALPEHDFLHKKVEMIEILSLLPGKEVETKDLALESTNYLAQNYNEENAGIMGITLSIYLNNIRKMNKSPKNEIINLIEHAHSTQSKIMISKNYLSYFPEESESFLNSIKEAQGELHKELSSNH